MSYDNTNSGILTRNDKGDNPSRPDYRGSINIDGVDYWLSGWIKVGREGTKLAGEKYMSLSVKAKDQQQSKPARGGTGFEDMPDSDVDDVPF